MHHAHPAGIAQDLWLATTEVDVFQSDGRTSHFRSIRLVAQVDQHRLCFRVEHVDLLRLGHHQASKGNSKASKAAAIAGHKMCGG